MLCCGSAELSASSLEALGRAWPSLVVLDLELTEASTDMLTGMHPFLALKTLKILIDPDTDLYEEMDPDAWDFQLLRLPKLEYLRVLAFECTMREASRDVLERSVRERFPRLSSICIKRSMADVDLTISDGEDRSTDDYGYGNEYHRDCDYDYDWLSDTSYYTD